MTPWVTDLSSNCSNVRQIIPKYMTLLDSDNYVTRRQALKVRYRGCIS